MTDQNEIEPEVETGSEPDQTETETETTPNSEAAKYRTRLRETESERDTLRDSLEAARRQIAEAHSGLTRPAALWAAGVDVADLFDADTGQLDRDKLTAAVTQAADQLGVETRHARTNRSYWTGGPFGPTTTPGSSGSKDRDNFADAFRPADRR